jgi:hypothetical protein
MLDLARVRLERFLVDDQPEDLEAARRVEVQLVACAQRDQGIDVDRLAAEPRRPVHPDRHADRARSGPRRAGFVHGLVGRLAKHLDAREAHLVEPADEAAGRHLLVDLIPLAQARRLLLDVRAGRARDRERRDVTALARFARPRLHPLDSRCRDHQRSAGSRIPPSSAFRGPGDLTPPRVPSRTVAPTSVRFLDVAQEPMVAVADLG